MSPPIRVAKFLSHAGVCSRRQASRLITAERVRVNGALAQHITHVSSHDHITVDGEEVLGLAPKRYFAYHKPVGIDCKLQPHNPHSLIHHLPAGPRVYPVGRLDKDSRGLLILTNDGALCQRLSHPDFAHQKEYWVEVDKPLNPEFFVHMRSGITLGEHTTRPCVCEPLSTTRFKIILTQGLNRQIRKMAKHCGYRVTDLMRVRIGDYVLQPELINEHHFQALTAEQVYGLQK
ncbi:pseudouridine synthase [Pseudoalteromonas sp. CO325X]|uniref:pseudouridine synthase n=1 Tax=Pseudoalteromonas sp. CO325X TaxID=1777262 RepID=UPI001023CA9D|nr:RNA pseudouridine synthase [Pseudoalteromonas sp. CO325X]RZF81929.1 pseudouridine synthase [Pseudoalteromonas sp. CO325X]